jgi:PAS domain S-box-containing protein
VKEFGYDKIFNQIYDSVYILDSQGIVLSFNKSAQRFQHLLYGEIKNGIHFTDLISPERKTLVNSIIQNTVEHRTSQMSEAQYMDAKGAVTHFEVTYYPIVNDEDVTTQVCITSRDITHEKTFERKSSDLVKELSELIDHANAMIFSVDTQSYLTEWNRECERITDFEKNDVLAQKAGGLIGNGHEGKFQEILDLVLKGESISNQEIDLKTKNANVIKILVNATPRKNTSQKVIGVLFVGQDITELSNYRQSLEEQVRDRTDKLREALKKEKEFVELKNRFVSVASHEFKVPLSSISSAVNALRNNTKLTTRETMKLDIIDKQTAYMRSLLDDILSLRKSETNQLKADLTSIDIVEFLEKIVDEMLASTQHSHFITKEFKPSTIKVKADEKLLRNIFVNLLSNAIKFSPHEKQVDLMCIASDDHVEITVTDFGIGIEEKDLTRIFEPFNRGSNTGDIKGTGLGLSIVKRAVESMDGTLSIDSVPGKGTTMTIRLKSESTLPTV